MSLDEEPYLEDKRSVLYRRNMSSLYAYSMLTQPNDHGTLIVNQSVFEALVWADVISKLPLCSVPLQSFQLFLEI